MARIWVNLISVTKDGEHTVWSGLIESDRIFLDISTWRGDRK